MLEALKFVIFQDMSLSLTSVQNSLHVHVDDSSAKMHLLLLEFIAFLYRAPHLSNLSIKFLNLTMNVDRVEAPVDKSTCATFGTGMYVW